MFAALLLARWGLNNHRIHFDTPFYKFGGFDEMRFNHDLTRKVTIDIQFDYGKEPHTLNMVIDANGNVAYELTNSVGRRISGWSINAVGPQVKEIGMVLDKVWFITAIRRPVPLTAQIGVGTQTSQPIDPDGTNISSYLVNRWSDRDPKWEIAEEWLRMVDPGLKILKVPITGMDTTVRTTRTGSGVTTDVSMSNQGAGIQNALSIISALVFSPEGSTLIVEEPEAHLHPDAQQMLVDLTNKAVNEWGKQVILITHSWEVILPFFSDIGKWGSSRGASHPKADSSKFSISTLARKKDDIQISRTNLDELGKFSDARDSFKTLWG